MSQVTAPVNIAVIKYWGKRDTCLNLPTNSSLSITIHHKSLCSNTSVSASLTGKDRLTLNGSEELVNERMEKVLSLVRQDSSSKVDVVSNNNFPTAAGVASSASGYAALSVALAEHFGVDDPHTIEQAARQGSGSACRSLYGGFVAWDVGTRKDGQDSGPRKVLPHTYWPELRVLILILNPSRKEVPSTSGMMHTVDTSSLFRRRLATVEAKLPLMEEALKNRDFHVFAEMSMRDSNEFHACCLDSYPPISYLTDASHMAIEMVHDLNSDGVTRAGYSFDAGPNPVLFTTAQYLDKVLTQVSYSLGVKVCDDALNLLASPASLNVEGLVDRLIVSCPGPGPLDTFN